MISTHTDVIPRDLNYILHFKMAKDFDLETAAKYVKGELQKYRYCHLKKSVFVPRKYVIRFYEQDGDNFVRNMVTVAVWHKRARIPRFLSKLKLKKSNKKAA